MLRFDYLFLTTAEPIFFSRVRSFGFEGSFGFQHSDLMKIKIAIKVQSIFGLALVAIVDILADG